MYSYASHFTVAAKYFDGSPYHYTPTRWVAITFLSLFSISTIVHTVQAVRYRIWWLLPTACLCGLLEILGWSARLWPTFSISLSAPFQMQITATILGPTPLLAANFVILGIIIQRLGVQYSRLSPKWYAILFCTCDLVSLIVQGAGGGAAAVASGNGLDPAPGGHIMLGGIVFQLLTITIYSFSAGEFYLRWWGDRPLRAQSSEMHRPMDHKTVLMTVALAFSTLCLFIRAIYRTIELIDGWSGKVISTQILFNVLDGVMILLATYTLNLAHPGLLLGPGSALTSRGTGNSTPESFTPNDLDDKSPKSSLPLP